MKFDVGGKYRAQAIIAIIMGILFLVIFDIYYFYSDRTMPVIAFILMNVLILGFIFLFIVRMSMQMAYIIYDDRLKIDFWTVHREFNASDIATIALFIKCVGKNRTYTININFRNNSNIELEFVKDKKLRAALADFSKRNNIGFSDEL